MPPPNDQERTEPATPKRRFEARKKGQVASSKELPTAIVITGGVVFFMLAGGWMVRNYMGLCSDIIARSGQISISPEGLTHLGMTIFWKVGLLAGPMVLCLAVLAVGSNVVQVGWFVAIEALSPKFSRLNPVAGLRRLVSLKSLMELPKSVIKLAIVGYVAWRTVQGEWAKIFPLLEASPWTAGTHMGEVIVKIGFRTGLVLLALALLDYIFQRWDHERSLKMTKQEVKDEHKQREGDPKVKGKIRQKQMQMALRRMMAEVPKADVVITNPQHLAIALQYDRETMTAPHVVAKGAGFLAQRIREVARANDVPVLEHKPLAQALYGSVEIGGQIPVNLYKAVAEILAHVYRQRGAEG